MKINIKAISALLIILILSTISLPMTINAVTGVDNDKDGLLDSQEDKNSNNIVDINETDPNNPDTDQDGFSDGQEVTDGTNPLDFNSYRFVYPKEIDTNQDGVIDKNYTVEELLSLFGLKKIVSSDIASTASCDRSEVIIGLDIFNCKYPLNTSVNKNFTFGSDKYLVKPVTSKLETKCNLESNNTSNAYIYCSSIAFDDVMIGENNLELFFRQPNKDLIELNNTLKINFILNKSLDKVKELDAQADLKIDRNCLPAESYDSTTCTFKLPSNTVLPADYMMGIGVEPGGVCTQKANSNLVECKNVPTGESRTMLEIKTTLNSSFKYKSLISAAKSGHLEESDSGGFFVKFIEGTTLETISGFTTNYVDRARLYIYSNTNEVIHTIEGYIRKDKSFMALTPVRLSDKLVVGNYVAKIESTSLTNYGSSFNSTFFIQILPNTQESIEIINKAIATPRTAGFNIYLITQLIFLLIAIYILIKYRKNLKSVTTQIIYLIIFNLVIVSNLGPLVLQSSAQNVTSNNVALTGFNNFNCGAKEYFKDDLVNCTFDAPNPLSILKNRNFYLYREIRPGSVWFSNPCNSTNILKTKWKCDGLKMGDLGQNININLGALNPNNLSLPFLESVQGLTKVNVVPKTLTSFSNYNCFPKQITVQSTISCTMDISNEASIPDRQTILAVHKSDEGKISWSKPCSKQGIKWVCLDLPINSLGNDRAIHLYGVDYFDDLNPDFNLKAIYETKSPIAIVNSIQEFKTGSMSVLTTINNRVTTNSEVNEELKIRYFPTTRSGKIFFKVYNRITGELKYSSEGVTNFFQQEFNAIFKPIVGELLLIEACNGSTVDNCTPIDKRLKHDVLPKINILSLFDGMDLTADRMNVIFTCDKTFPLIDKCIEVAKRTSAWDSKPVTLDFNDKVTTDPNDVSALSYGPFAIEPLKSNKSKFNLFVLDTLLDSFDKKVILKSLSDKGIKAKNTVFMNINFANGRSWTRTPDFAQVADLNKSNLTYDSPDNSVVGVITQYLGANGIWQESQRNVLTHELGHTIFGLKDEYSEGEQYAPRTAYPNCLPYDQDRKTIWTNIVGSNPDGALDPFYNDWVKEMRKYKNQNRPNMALDEYIKTVTGDDISAEQFTTRMNVNGECYGPEKGGLVFKPTRKSLMTANYPVMGTVNRARVQNILNLYTGKQFDCSNTATNYPACDQFLPCANGATNPPACNSYPPCTNAGINPPICDQFPPCSNNAKNPPKCDQYDPCINGALNSPKCDKYTPCVNKATNPPTCNKWLDTTTAYCPVGTGFDPNIGFCSDANDVYGPFPKAILDSCIAKYKTDVTCTQTYPVKINDIAFSLNKYPRDKFIALRGNNQCPFGTKPDTAFKNYCVEYDIANPTDLSLANIFGPFTKNTVAACVDPKIKGGNSCYLIRYKYSLFKTIYKP